MEQSEWAMEANCCATGNSARPGLPDRDHHGLLQVWAFGMPSFALGGEPIFFVRRKTGALLLYLAVPRRVHSRDALANLLWGEMPQEHAAANLRKVLVELRERVDASVLISHHTVA